MCVIKLNEVYKPRKNYTVIVKTITFNHSRYIEDTLNGIAMQNTNFPFVNIVLEDNSTDGEQEVIRIWLDRECDMSLAEYYDIPTAVLIIAPHKENINCTFAIYFHKKNLFQQKDIRESQVQPWRSNSKYEALCEGDDYWTDPLKLQKQVDFLESHHDYGLCHTDYNVIDEEGNQKFKSKVQIYNDDEYLYKMISNGNCIGTLTVMFRKSVYDKIPKYFIDKGWALGDKPLWLEIAAISKIGYIDEITSSYRVAEGSASHGQDMIKVIQFATSSFEIDKFYDNIYNLRINRPKSEFYEYCMKEALRLDDKKVAGELFLRSCGNKSVNLKIFIFFLCTILSLSTLFHYIGVLKR